MKPITVPSAEQVIENIHRYQEAIAKNPKIRARVARVWSWYAYKDDQSHAWKFAPSKFIGYRGANTPRYLAESGKDGEFDGRVTERVLSEWFMAPEPGSRLERELMDALRTFLAGFAKAPGARARVSVLKADVTGLPRHPLNLAGLFSRISSDPAICGGT